MRSCDTLRATLSLVALVVLALAAPPRAQDATPATPLTLVSREGRRPVPTTLQGGREMIALDDVAALFQVSVKEDTLAGGVTVSSGGRTIVLSPNRAMASVDGRLVTLSAAPARAGRRWLVPLDFLSVALSTIHDQRIDLRRASRLLVVGDVRLPRVSATIDADPAFTRSTIEITPAAPAAVTQEAGRVIVRIDADALDLAALPGGSGLIDRIRAGEQPNTVVIGLQAGAGIPRTAVATAGATTRVIVEVPPAASAAPAPQAPDVDPRLPPPDPQLPDPEASAPILGASRAWRTIVIDPGHGGDDVGVRGPGGLEEKGLTLDIARRLEAMIESRLGLRVVLTREDDRTLGIDERAAVANNGKADLLLSLHVNGSRSTTPAGAEVFYLQLDRESEEVVRAAAIEGVALPALGGGTRRLDLIPWDLAQARHLEASAILAATLQEELARQVPMSPQPIRQAPVRILAAANMPAALVEVAYLTNPAQEARLRTDDFKVGVAQAIFSAIVRFRAWSEETRTP